MTSENGGSVGVLLIAHGSRLDSANQELIALAKELAELGRWRVFPCYLELCAPTIDDAGAACVASGIRRVVLAPYFLSAGRHVEVDLEGARGRLSQRHPGATFTLAGPLGPHPLLLQILLERISAAGPEALAGD